LEPQIAAAHDLFPHIRIVLGMVIGLGVARLLSGLAKILQHPKQYRLYPLHFAWACSVMLMLIHFWWWEFGLIKIEVWSFGKYFFVFSYAVSLFMLCALLFPDSMEDYRSHEDFFFERRGWFFGVLAATYIIDVGDTLMKGTDHLLSFGPEYLIRTPLIVLLCIAAAVVRNRAFHATFLVFKVGYQLFWILRHFNTMA